MSKNEEVPDNIEGVWTERDDQDLRWADGVRAEELLLRAKAVQGTKRKDLSPRWDPVVRAAEGKRRRAKRKFNWLVRKYTEKGIEQRRRYLEMLTREKT
ncbi:hypothetical protein E4U35_007833 [Claviceps purpurea]|nr:hypothetical protein E4U35_007833 [Claviceps purpurea]KAG6209191.1 hypothetical protein E4U34_007710 [Claviceps purpurea]KAG6218167.1 hypothetical protein E4U26_007688 [Claviceps purpurea]KAG6236112.1 hypothetical protein E4U24_007919 [Claviceps purpurea]